MSATTPLPDYDRYAHIQNKSKSAEYIELVMFHLEQLMLRHLPQRAHILDLCCGTGPFLQALENKGYNTTGLDGSEALLRYARQNAPNSELILDDARFFELPPTFDGVISQMSLNMIVNLEELTRVFHNVYAALKENGIFAFNVFVQDWYPIEEEIGSVGGQITDEYVEIGVSYGHPEERVCETKSTWFELLDGKWQRSDNTFLVKYYYVAEFLSALEQAGFKEVICYNNERDLKVAGASRYATFVGRKRAEN